MNSKHGKTKTKEYRAWQLMKARCYYENTINYHDYGGRGIRVCDRWLHSFENFLADMGEKPSSGHSLDRYPNVNGNYEPSNCRWATRSEQSLNRRNIKHYELNGEIKPLSEWCQIYNLDIKMVWHRINKNWNIYDALNTPKCLENEKLHTANMGVKPFLFKIGDEEKTMKEWCKLYGKNLNTVKTRYFRGMSLENSLNK